MSGAPGVAMVPDGAPSSAAANSAAAQLVVYGTPLAADPAELRDLAAAVDRGSAQVERGRALLRRALAILQETAVLDAGSAGPAIARCWEVLLSISAVISDADAIAAALRAAATDYERAEAEARAGFTRGLTVTAPPALGLPWDPIGMLRPLTMLGVAFAGALARGQLTPTDAQFGAALESWAGTLTGMLGVSWVGTERPDSSTVVLAGLLAPALTVGLTIGATARVHQVDPPGAVPTGSPATSTGPAPTGVAGAIGSLYGLYPRHGGPEAAIRIDRVVGPDGAVSWQVLVPGTQTELVPELALPEPAFGPPHPGWAVSMPAPGLVLRQPDNPINNRGNPFDWGTNLQAFAAMDTAVEDGVIQAMEQAGIPPDEPVLLVGHSQGAMTTMRLAEDPAFTERFEVRSVITVGGPVGHIDTPGDVAVLNIEHVDDLTSGLENTANPGQSGRTTVIRDLAASPDPADRTVTSVAQAHDIPAYVRTAQMIDASTDPAVRAWLAASQDVLGGPSDSAASRYYQIERE
ncbi:hypothetical protein EXU48_01755 [Occultella glacieicola]|uniref:Alpha/beta hydrolase n=1 Tax=Occultella glacieicola TaxID=2518684 RepID=A0ABY2E8W3_9MICO|nr:hypothetical protein [Occultella glacieicola]TDE98945.1 hypothetical protein EXU48_01755 [Occultella glacieicola]